MIAAAEASVYEQGGYLDASAAHVDAVVELATAGGAALPLLRTADGRRRTVYGLPRPLGARDDAAQAALADAIAGDDAPLAAILSPLDPGPRLAQLLVERGLRSAGERAICVTELDGGDPDARFHRRAVRSLRTAARRGGAARVEPLTDGFGPLYRAAMTALDAPPIYHFGDGYLRALATLPHYQVTVTDAHGVAAAVLFLHDGHEAYYHLGGRRGHAPLLGAMTLALAEGIREAARRGCRIVVLGGGRSDAPDDALLAFKRQLSTTLVPRPSVERP